jgi:hypothetical protein
MPLIDPFSEWALVANHGLEITTLLLAAMGCLQPDLGVDPHHFSSKLSLVEHNWSVLEAGICSRHSANSHTEA